MLHHYRRQPIVCNPSAPKALKPKLILTAAQKAGIVRMKKNGNRSALIVAKIGCSEQAIQQVWTAYLKKHPDQKKLSTAYTPNAK